MGVCFSSQLANIFRKYVDKKKNRSKQRHVGCEHSQKIETMSHQKEEKIELQSFVKERKENLEESPFGKL